VADAPAGLTTAAWLVLAALFGAGLFTTVAGIGLTLTLGAVLFSDQQLYSNHLYLLVLVVGLLTVARSGSALSIDALRGRGAASIPSWPLVLLRVQISIVYLFAGLSKLNATFLSGTVVAVTLRREGPLAVPAEWRTFEPMAAFSLLAILTELFLAAALWLPRWRRAAFVVGLGLHVGIAVWFVPTGQLAIFSLIILAPYLLFLEVAPRGATVVWDGSCSFCRGWVRLFTRLDWLHALRIVPSSETAELDALGIAREDADRALQLVRGEHRSQGFRAVVGVLELTPAAFLWAPMLRLPPIAWLGDRAYRRVAERRRCSIVPPAATERGVR
jgi:predicted DCC family thiol-disulfide oxidoreductase YuxK